MFCEIFPSITNSDDNGYKRWNPIVSFKPMQDFVPEKGNDQGNDGHDDNSNIDTDIVRIYGGKGLPANDTVDNGKPGHCRKVQNHNDVNQV